MLIDPEKARERLNSPNNLANRLAEFRNEKKYQFEDGVLSVKKGYGRLPAMPPQVRAEIARDSISGEKTTKEIAEQYSVSTGTVSNIRKRAEELTNLRHEQANRIEERLKEVALEKLMLSMGLITQEKLSELKVKDLASTAASLSKVFGSVRPVGSQPLVNLVIYSPEVRDEKSFKIVEINSENK